MPQFLMKYEKGKLCESRGRKVTDLTGKNPMMAGPPDNAARINHVCDLTRTANVASTRALPVLSFLTIRKNQT